MRLRGGASNGRRARITVRRFPHYDTAAACELIEQDDRSGSRPVIVADGFCPSCGSSRADRAVPAMRGGARRQAGARRYPGARPARRDGPRHAHGDGGGGSLRWRGVSSPDVIVGASLAKALGVPMAVLSGSEPVIRRFEQQSETRVHCSPPSLASLRAAEHALALNRRHGDDRRHLPWRNLSRGFAQGCVRSAWPHRGSLPGADP